MHSNPRKQRYSLMKKSILKMSLDIVMIIVLVLLYNSHVANLIFHEVAGLLVCGLFVIHCLLNRKWIIDVSKKLCSKSLPFKTKFGYSLNILLCITFIILIISGINTSQILFPSNSHGSIWRGIHHQAAALSIILVGVHIALHWSFIANMAKKTLHIPPTISSRICIIMVGIIFCFGSYNLITSNFKNWLIEPFTNQSKQTTHTASHSIEVYVAKDSENKSAKNNSTPAESKSQEPKSVDTSPLIVLDTITTYLSIIGVFVIATYYFEKILIKRNKMIMPTQR